MENLETKFTIEFFSPSEGKFHWLDRFFLSTKNINSLVTEWQPELSHSGFVSSQDKQNVFFSADTHEIYQQIHVQQSALCYHHEEWEKLQLM